MDGDAVLVLGSTAVAPQQELLADHTADVTVNAIANEPLGF